jgi:hypothetical protein
MEAKEIRPARVRSKVDFYAANMYLPRICDMGAGPNIINQPEGSQSSRRKTVQSRRVTKAVRPGARPAIPTVIRYPGCFRGQGGYAAGKSSRLQGLPNRRRWEPQGGG